MAGDPLSLLVQVVGVGGIVGIRGGLDREVAHLGLGSGFVVEANVFEIANVGEDADIVRGERGGGFGGAGAGEVGHLHHVVGHGGIFGDGDGGGEGSL